MIEKTDIVIAGSGVAGLYSALKLPTNKKITIITKDAANHSDSFLAQGGICVLKGEEDYESYFEDTMRAGHYENNKASVDVMIRSSQAVIADLIGYGAEFEMDGDDLAYTREGAHSVSRILFHADITGKEITNRLLDQVRMRPNVTIEEYVTMVDIVTDGSICQGMIVRDADGSFRTILSDYTILACGGIGGLYHDSTNYPHLTGDAVAISLKHGIALQNIDYVQIHPTTLYSEKPGRRFLISESVRGEGAILLNADGRRFVNELLPRDAVAKAIYTQMKTDGKPYVSLSMAPVPVENIRSHFPNIYQYCLEEGYDVTKECIPVVPAQHYFMGGIQVNLQSRTSMEHLYAVGETSCNGVHGANRLASNSLLESLVFAGRAAHEIATAGPVGSSSAEAYAALYEENYSAYMDSSALTDQYRTLVMDEMERMRMETKKRHTLAYATQ